MALGGAARGRSVARADDARRFDADDVAAPVDHLGQLPHVGRVERAAVFGLRREPAIAEQQPRQAEPRGHQFLEPQRGGGQPAGKLGHEGDAGLADAAADFVGLVGFEIERGGTIDRLAGIAGGEDRQRAVPAGGEQQHGIDVGARGERTEAVARAGRPALGDFGRPMGDRIAERPHFEPIGQRRRAGAWRVSHAWPRPTTPTRSFMGRSESERGQG